MKKPARKSRRAASTELGAGSERKSEQRRRAPDPAELEQALGHRFEDRTLLRRALTHASAGDARHSNNERLEFLGDRVLALLTAQALLDRHPEAQEGDLAPRLNALVRGETCAEIAESIGVGAHLHMARSEAMTGGRRKAALLGDAMEALIAAVYLDGGQDAAAAVFERHWRARLEAQGEEAAPIDAKTALQEWAQARGMAPPSYRMLERKGPDHAPSFTIEARLDSGAFALADGASKRVAEQAAATSLLDAVREAERQDQQQAKA